MRAEQISSQHLRSNMGQGSTQTVVSGREMSLACMLSVLDYANVLYRHASTRVLKPLEAVYQAAFGFITDENITASLCLKLLNLSFHHAHWQSKTIGLKTV